MKLVRYDYPNLLNGVDRWFSDPMSGFGDFSKLFERLGNGMLGAEAAGQLATDVYEDDERYYARFEVPGVKKEALKVDVEGGLLSVAAEKRSGEGDDAVTSSAKRVIRLPEGVDPEKIAAKLEDGVLTVSLGKAEERRPRSIEVS